MQHTFNKYILRKYDIRGIYNEQLFDEDAYFFGLTYGKVAVEEYNKNPENFKRQIIIGRDGRASSPKLYEECINGLLDSGIDVVEIGLVPSPMTNFVAEFTNSIACVEITASHNPKEYNGLKLDFKNRPFFDDKIQHLAEMAKDIEPVSQENRGKLTKHDYLDDYIEHITKGLKINKNIKVCFDCGNGVAGAVIDKLLQKLQMPNASAVFKEVDGTFPNHHPDPTVAKNMQYLSKKVIDEGLDIGIGFDGDADRVGIIDDKGRLLYGDQILLILANNILSHNKGAKIIAEVKASKVVFDGIKQNGGEAIMSKTGNVFIRSLMDKTGAILGGETSGHIFFMDKFNGVDDGIYAGLRMLEILSEILESGKKLSNLVDEIPETCCTHDLKLPVDEADKFSMIKRIQQSLQNDGLNFVDIDGVRRDNEHGWWMIRASNTSNVLTGRCEADKPEDLGKVKEEFEKYVRLAGYKDKINFDD